MAASVPVSTRYVPQRVTTAVDVRSSLAVARNTTARASVLDLPKTHRVLNDEKGKAYITAPLPSSELGVAGGYLLDEMWVFITKQYRVMDGVTSNQRGALHTVNHAISAVTADAVNGWTSSVVSNAAHAGVVLDPDMKQNSQEALYELYKNTRSSGQPPSVIYLCERAIWEEMGPFGVVFVQQTDRETGETAVVGGYCRAQMLAVNGCSPGDALFWILKPAPGQHGSVGPFAFQLVSTRGGPPTPAMRRYVDAFGALRYCSFVKAGRVIGLEYGLPPIEQVMLASGLKGTPASSFTASKFMKSMDVQLCTSRGSNLWGAGL
jgi:hypothetical protein